MQSREMPIQGPRKDEVLREAAKAVDYVADTPEGYGRVTILIRGHEVRGIEVTGYRPMSKSPSAPAAAPATKKRAVLTPAKMTP
jgi:hypothetical protein